jgi:hypothetical protein
LRFFFAPPSIPKPAGSSYTGATVDAQSYNYVGGLTGIAVDTNLVDLNVVSASSSDTIVGGHIVGGLVGVFAVTDPITSAPGNAPIQVFNVSANTSLWSTWHFGKTDTGDDINGSFTTGKEYYQGKTNARAIPAGSPAGKYYYTKTYYDKPDGGVATGMSVVGNLFGIVTHSPRYSAAEESMFSEFEARYSNISNIPAPSEARKLVIQNASGSAMTMRGDIAGGLIGVVDDYVTVDYAKVTGLSSIIGMSCSR